MRLYTVILLTLNMLCEKKGFLFKTMKEIRNLQPSLIEQLVSW